MPAELLRLHLRLKLTFVNQDLVQQSRLQRESAKPLRNAPNRLELQKLFMTAVDFCTTVVLQQQRKLPEKKAWSSK
jgi:hypothetical protein